MRLGVFGGSFDPPHNGHLGICRMARESLGIGRLIVSVSKNPLKGPADASDDHRKRMAELLVAELDPEGSFAAVSTWELDRPGPSYTIDLLNHLRSTRPGDELELLVGEDSYRSMPAWHSSEMIPALCRITVFSRSTASGDEPFAGRGLPPARIVEFDQPVSATEVRELIAIGASAAHLLPPSIAGYIERNGLYR
ncbi:MAG: nicotinate (nicotinamide) nucleotide adenylyltransferase [Chlorobiaceae bacterium]|nr:nicotinate (nicotinamide) nucleotide adenylyltransferase [Chlorobiaceae bacterium]